MRFTLVEMSPSGGLFQFSYQLGEHIAARGHAVELLTGRDPELAPRTEGFVVSPVLPTWHPGARSAEPLLLRKVRRVSRGVRYLLALVMVNRLLRRRRPDVVLWSMPRFPVDSWMRLTLRRRLRGSVFGVLLHEPRPLRPQGRRGSLYKKDPVALRSFAAALGTMDVIFVLGQRAREYVVDTFKPVGDVVVIEHGDEGVFLAGDAQPPPADTTGPCVLFFGVWNRWKGLGVLLEAFRRVRRQVPQARLVVAGAVGNSVDFAQIERKARQIPGVELRPGYVPLSEVPGLICDARVVAVPYLRGNQSGVVHLAQTFARPVVATDVGDIPAAVPHGEAGLIVPPRDPEAFATALQHLLEDPAEARRLGDGGRARLETQGSWDQISADVVSAVDTAVRRRRTTPAPRRPPDGVRSPVRQVSTGRDDESR